MSAEPKLQFVDTNVLVYAHDLSAAAKHQAARALIQELWESGNGCVSVQVLQEFYVNVTRKVPKPLESQTAAHIVADLARWTVHAPDVEDVLEAIAIQRRHQISFWDAMIVASAVQLGCDVVWSEDLNAGQVYEGVRVVSPFVMQK